MLPLSHPPTHQDAQKKEEIPLKPKTPKVKRIVTEQNCLNAFWVASPKSPEETCETVT